MKIMQYCAAGNDIRNLHELQVTGHSFALVKCRGKECGEYREFPECIHMVTVRRIP
jgi:hypothetical protein